MSSSYSAISKVDFSFKFVRETISILRGYDGSSKGSWSYYGESEKTDAELSDEFDQGYITLWGPDSLEVVISKTCIGISECTAWKYLLYESHTRELVFDKIRKVTDALKIKECFFVPDSTFLSTSPVELFLTGEDFIQVLNWTEKNLREITEFDEFEGRESHHDVFFRMRKLEN